MIIPHFKFNLAKTLPCHQSDLTLRVWTRPDVDRLAGWPSYPLPFHPLNLSCAGQSSATLDSYFISRENDPCRLSLVADLTATPVVGYLALLDMDTATGIVGNLVVRLHPAHCGRGVGTAMMRLLISWAKKVGLTTLRLDVAATNERAVRCYGQAGFTITAEFWREEGNLSPADLTRAEYAFARPHVRSLGTGLQTRFYQMQCLLNPQHAGH